VLSAKPRSRVGPGLSERDAGGEAQEATEAPDTRPWWQRWWGRWIGEQAAPLLAEDVRRGLDSLGGYGAGRKLVKNLKPLGKRFQTKEQPRLRCTLTRGDEASMNPSVNQERFLKFSGKFGGIKSQQLATNPRRFFSDVGSRTADRPGARTIWRFCWPLEDGACYSVLPGISLIGCW
jgi:hypothetical protein